MAKIRLDQEVLAIEALIEAKDHDESFRRLILARERLGRRPEYRYLQALFDATFGVRPEADIIREINNLVGEQPDFAEPVALLAFLFAQIGDQARAEVFAREAIHAANPLAQRRARAVLGDRPTRPPANEPPFAERATGTFRALADGFGPEPASAQGPTPFRDEPKSAGDSRRSDNVQGPQRRITSASDELRVAEHVASSRSPFGSEPASDLRGKIPPAPRVPRGDLGVALATREQAAPESKSPGSYALSSPPPADAGRSSSMPSMETIAFSPSGSPVPGPPSIPPEALIALADSAGAGLDLLTESPNDIPTYPGRSVRRSPVPAPNVIGSPSSFAPRNRPSARPASKMPAPATTTKLTVVQLDPELATDRTGISLTNTTSRGGKKPSTRPPKMPMSIPPPAEVTRQWFRYAREQQLVHKLGEGEGGTSAMLLDLAERAILGQTPFCPEPVPFDRSGLILIEQRLEPFCNTTRAPQSAAERAAATTAAAFLLALLLKECDARAVDAAAEDGACKAMLPSGTAVRPLQVAASFIRGRGVSLVDTFDRAATAHMRRISQPPTPIPTTGVGSTLPLAAVRGDPNALSVGRRDLDAGTLAVRSPDAPSGPLPRQSLRALADNFWTSSLGREISGPSRRIGAYAPSDIDAIERYICKTVSDFGLAPPGTIWPWIPALSQDENILSWGAALGEVLIALYDGRWEADPGNPDDKHLYRVALVGGVIIWPVAHMHLRIARGISHDLTVYLDCVGRLVGRQALAMPPSR